MRVSKEYIASQEREKNSIKRIEFDANNVEANEVVESVKQFVTSNQTIQEAKAAQNGKMPKAFYDEITSTTNFFVEKALKGESTAELQDYLADIEKAVVDGEFKATQQQTATKNYVGGAKTTAPKAENNGFKKVQYREDGFVTTPKPKEGNEVANEISDAFFNFQKENLKGLSIPAINAFLVKRNECVSLASNPKFEKAALTKTNEQLAKYDEHIEKGDLEKHLLLSMIGILNKEAGLVETKTNKQATKNYVGGAKTTRQDKFLDEAIQDSEIKTSFAEAKKAWIQEGKDGVLQHTKDDYLKLQELATKSQNVEEFESGLAKLNEELRADAQNPERAKVAANQAKKQVQATEPKPEPQTDEPDAAAKKFEANGENSEAMDNLRAEAKDLQKVAPKNTQNQVNYSRQRQTQTA